MATKKKNNTSICLDDVITTDAPSNGSSVDSTSTVSDFNSVIPDSALINVKSNSFGKLIFVSKKTGERIVWEKCGEIQQVTLATLRTIKLECINFYKEQWIILMGFADENAKNYTPNDLYKQLFVAQYYKDLIDPSDYERICSMSPSEIKDKVSLMSDGAKENLVVALNTYIEKGILDSNKAIKTFEEVLGCDLRDPAD